MNEHAVLRLHLALVDLFKDEDPISPCGPRDSVLLGSACSRPHTSLGKTEKYRTTEQKAAALFHSLIKNHPFHNGNKRTALVATILFLDEHKRHLKPDISDDSIFDFVRSVASNAFPDSDHQLDDDDTITEIAKWLGQATQPRNHRPSMMRTMDFLAKCGLAGGTVKESASGWVVRGRNGKSIRLAGSTAQLEGPAIKRYASTLGLAGPSAGVYIEEFQAGIPTDQATMLRLRNVLRRLADA